MSSQIGIIELYEHNEVLNHFCKLLLLSDYQIYVFCKETVFKQLPDEIKESKIIWKLKGEEQSIHSFINSHKASLRHCDHIIVTTVFSEFKSFYNLATWTKTTFVIHSAYTWFEPLKHIHLRYNQRFSDILRLIKFILLGQVYWRKKILNAAYKISLPSREIRSHVESFCSETYRSKLIHLPFVANEEIGGGSNASALHLVIPGTISPDVRNYEEILSAFQQIRSHSKRPIHLYLLGNGHSNYGQKIISAFKQLESKYFILSYFSGFITQSLYDNIIRQADYLILPLRPFTQFYVFREKTCLSKLSGSINDMIRFGKKAITSQYALIDKDLDPCLIKYRTETELIDLLLNIDKSSLNSLNIQMYKNYSLASLLEDFKYQMSL